MTESWLTEKSNFVLEINGYNSHTLNRVGRTGRGMNIFHLEYKVTEVISQFSAVEVSYESILLKIAIPGLSNMFVAGIYRPPNTPLADFTQFNTNMLEYKDNCRMVFASDFNIGVLGNSKAMRNYVDTFHQYGLLNEINLPTYVSPSTGIETSSTDHLSHILNCSRRSYVVSPAVPDHYAICAIFRIIHDSPPKSVRFRDFSEGNAELFTLNKEIEFISRSPPHSNPNEYGDYLVFFLNKKKTMNKYFTMDHLWHYELYWKKNIDGSGLWDVVW